MLGFLRRLRRKLLDEGHLRKYLVYAVGEIILVVLGILIALQINNWNESQKDKERARSHLMALSRDFTQMESRVSASIQVSERGRDRSKFLLHQLTGETPKSLADSTFSVMIPPLDYEVFSANTGSYGVLSASGDFELIQNDELLHELSEFFGAFEDLRVSEQLLISSQQDFIYGEGFNRDIPIYRYASQEVIPAILVNKWSESTEIKNGLHHINVRFEAVLEDYVFFYDSISRINNMISEELSKK